MQQHIAFNNLSKAFPGVQALDSVSIKILTGTVHGLIGENGAGKSTLLKILTGYHYPDKGDINLDGVANKFATPFEALKAGVSVIQQELQLVPNQTVAENVTLGKYASRHGLVNWNKMFAETHDFLEANDIDIDPKAKISQLSIGQQQMVEIAKAIYQEAKIIGFDEPTSSLSKIETDILFKIIRRLKADAKIVIYVTHRLNEIFELCDFCSVLKDGRHILTKSVLEGGLSRDELISAMTGKELKDIYGYRKRKIENLVLKTQDLMGEDVNFPANIEVHKKEIIGIFGLVGAGRSELARLIYGATKSKSGAILLNGNIKKQKSPQQSIEQGLMFCTEDRKKDGIINGRSIWENINISSRRHFSFAKFILNKKKEFSVADEQVNSLKIKTPNLLQNIVNLSGGNQQKVILGRWLSEKGMKVLIIDEPTRGIDVGAKYEIYNILYSLAEQGVGIIIVSSELQEITGVCDRVYVMREGRISKEIQRNDFKEEIILEYAFPHEGEKVYERN